MSFRSCEGVIISPRMARYRQGGMHSLLTSPKAKADSARMSATEGRSSAAIGKEKSTPLGVPLPMYKGYEKDIFCVLQ